MYSAPALYRSPYSAYQNAAVRPNLYQHNNSFSQPTGLPTLSQVSGQSGLNYISPSRQTPNHEANRTSHISQDSDNHSIKSNQTTGTVPVQEALLHHQDLESYRKTVKKSNDPKMQLDFAKQLVTVAEGIEKILRQK